MKAADKKQFKTSRGERVSYWSYLVGQNFAYTMVATYLGTYMMMIGVDLSKIATVMLIVKVWDAINDTIFGLIFDKVKFKSGNKCIPWLRISSALIPLATILIYVIPADASQALKLTWFTIAYLLWDTVYTLSDVPIYSMITTMTSNLNERNFIMSFGRIFGLCSGIVISMAISLMVSEKVGLSFGWVCFIVSMIAMAMMLPICFKGKERGKPDQEEESYSIGKMFHYLKTNKYLLLMFGSYILLNALTTTNSLSLFVSYYLFGSATFNTILIGMAIIPMIVMALLLPSILKYVDKFVLYFWCLVDIAVIGFVMYFVGYSNAVVYMVLRLLQVFPVTIFTLLAFMFTPDCAEYGRYTSGIDARGITFAIQTFSTKVAAAIASSAGIAILGLFGWVTINAGSFAEIQALNIVQPAQAIEGLWFTYTLVPAIGSALGIIPLLFYKLRDKDVKVMAQFNSGEITRQEAEHLLAGRKA